MNYNVTEDSSLSKEDSGDSSPCIEETPANVKNTHALPLGVSDSDDTLVFRGRRLNQQKKEEHRKSLSSKKAGRSDQRVRFDTAMSKALPVRARQLGRSLSRNEWVALRNAVRKQCTRVNTDTHTKRLAQLETRVNRLDKAFSADPGVQMADKVALIQLQLNLARQQMMELVSSSKVLAEGCTHVANKVRVFVERPFDMQMQSPGMPCQYFTVAAGSRLLCCTSCLSDRKDLLFETFGSDHALFKPEASICETDLLSVGLFREKSVPSYIQECHPFSFQEVWTKFLDYKFNR